MSCFPKSNPLPTLSSYLGKEIEAEIEHKVKMQFPAQLGVSSEYLRTKNFKI